jgi:hypothetical protein
MKVSYNGREFNWIEDWARVPDTPTSRDNGRTHGVAVAQDGTVIVFLQATPAVVFFAPDGNLKNSWGDRFLGAHGLTLVEDDGREFLWLTDERSGEVVKTTLQGETVLLLEQPSHPEYRAGGYAPTWVAVNEERFGGDGSIWVADGYGSSLVHQYDREGGYRFTLTGEEGAGHFDCPHGLYFRHAGDRHELFVADRGNSRIQVYDENGRFLRSFGEGVLELPCTCFEYDGELVIPELNARLTVLTPSGGLVGYLGANESVCQNPEWPNVPAEDVNPGKFNSPHSATVDGEGNFYVVEWMIGGRITKLERL